MIWLLWLGGIPHPLNYDYAFFPLRCDDPLRFTSSSESVRLNTLTNLRIQAWFRRLRLARRPISGCLTLLRGAWTGVFLKHLWEIIAGCLQVMKKLGQSQDLMGMGFLDCLQQSDEAMWQSYVDSTGWCFMMSRRTVSQRCSPKSSRQNRHHSDSFLGVEKAVLFSSNQLS